MRAINVTEFGGPEVLRPAEVIDPRPGPGQVLIEVAVAGVLGIDTVIRAGDGGILFPTTTPYVPGVGVAGRVTATGSAAPASLLGRRVVASMVSGGYAALAVADLDDTLEIPDGVGILDAMAVLHDGRTAIAVLEEIGVAADETVLVLPAAGGLGSNLVQLAAARGARVVALARGRGKTAILQDLGAAVVVDQTHPDWPARVRKALGSDTPIDTPIDVAFDGVGGRVSRDVLALVRSDGRYSNYGFAGGAGPAVLEPQVLRERRIDHRGMEQLGGFGTDQRERGRRALAYVADGTLRPLIGAVLPLDEAAAAHEALRRHTTLGKTLLLA